MESAGDLKIENDNYSVNFIKDENRIIFKGNFRLRTISNYNEIMQFIIENSEGADPVILDLANLEYINSSGIASIGLFLIKLKDSEKKIKIIGSRYVNWQIASLKDFQQINNNIEIEYVVKH